MSAPLRHAAVRDGAWAPAAPLLDPGLQDPRVRGAALWATPETRLPAVPARRPALMVGNLGACETRCLYVLVSDDSPSVTGSGGNDPLANRYAEAQAAFRALARACSCGRCLGAVVHFDQVGGAGPVPVREWRRGRRRLSPKLEAALSTPKDAMGTSRLGPSLKQALRVIKQHPAHRAVLIVASDFQLFDEDPGRVIAKLDTFAAERGSVHAVVLGRPIPDGVLAPPIVSHVVQPGSAPGALARAIARGLAEHRTGTAIPDDVAPADAAGASSAA